MNLMNRIFGDRTGARVFEPVEEPGLAEVVNTSETRIGFALGGGGTRGAFGVGALAYLTNVKHIGASVVSGTSVGALSALKLAGFAPAMQGAATTQLMDQWTALRNEADMWLWESWLSPLFDDPQFGASVRDFVESFLGVKRTRGIYRVETPSFEFPGWFWGLTALPVLLKDILERVGREAVGVQEGLEAGRVTAFTNLEPTKRQTEGAINPEDVRANENSGAVQLRMATVSLEKGLLRYITGNGALLERDNMTPVELVTIEEEDSECAPLVEKLDALQRKIRFNPDMAEDLAEQMKAVAQDLRACRRAHPPRMETRPARVGVVAGAMASAAAPTFFPPQTLRDESYVDGGIRELVPVDVAFRCGADLVYAISESSLQTSPTEVTLPGITPRPASTVWNLPSIALRSLGELTLDEIANDDVRGFGDAISVIAPTFNLFSGWLVDPGLISIWIDYGLMRAADVAVFPPGFEDGRLLTGQRAVELSDHLTRLRIAAWLAEHVIADAPAPPIQVTHSFPGFLPRWQGEGASVPGTSTGALDWVRCLRVLERAIVLRRENLGLLAGRNSSFLRGFERHPFNVRAVLWTPRNELRPALEPPARRLLRDMETRALFQVMPSGGGLKFNALPTPASASPPGTAAEISDMPPGLIQALRTP